MEEIRQDENIAIQAIYGRNIIQEGVDIDTTYGTVTLRLDLPRDYPLVQPIFTLKIPNLRSNTADQRRLERDLYNILSNKLKALFVPGVAVLFDFIECVRDHLSCLTLDGTNLVAVNEILEVEKVISNPTRYPECPRLFHSSQPTEYKKSTFIAHAAIVKSIQELELVRNALRSNSIYMKSTHNIAAYRIAISNGNFIQDGDDDGEKAAGSRLLNLLQLTNVYNVYIVVSRKFGGIELGPVRFKLINNTARQLLVEMALIP